MLIIIVILLFFIGGPVLVVAEILGLGPLSTGIEIGARHRLHHQRRKAPRTNDSTGLVIAIIVFLALFFWIAGPWIFD